MADLDETTLAKLAREMIMNIRNYKAVFEDFGITEEDFYEIEKNEFFKRAKEQFLIEWNSTTSTADRLKFQSQAGLEQLLPVLIRRAMEGNEPLNSANETGKMLAKLGGIGEVKEGGPAVDRFQIVINLGADVDGKQVIESYDKTIAIDMDPIKPVVKEKA